MLPFASPVLWHVFSSLPIPVVVAVAVALCVQGGRGQYSGSSKTLLPMTIALLKSCTSNASGDGFVLPFVTAAGAPIDVQYIKIYARVLAKNDADMTKTVFSIHDGSGSLEVTHYHSDDDVYWAEISGQLE